MRLKDILDSGSALSDQLELHVEILTKVPLGILILDEKGIIQSTNHYLRSRLGYGWRSELTRDATHFSRFLPDNLADKADALLAAWFQNPETRPINGGRPVPVKRKDGGRENAMIHLYPLERTQHGDVLALSEADAPTRYCVVFIFFLVESLYCGVAATCPIRAPLQPLDVQIAK